MSKKIHKKTPDHRLKYLTIKPFAPCTLKCPYCDSRQQLLNLSKGRILGLEDWARVFEEANNLGTEYVDISGGEPSLYKALDALVWEAKRYGWFVSMNTNGQHIDESFTSKLSDVCLDQIIVSVVSLKPAVHDRIRGQEGCWLKMQKSINAIAQSGIRLVIHFLITRQSYRDLPELLDRCFDWGVNALALVYPENDHEERHILLDDKDILHFREIIQPDLINHYVQNAPDRQRDISTLHQLFKPHGLSGVDYAQGRYWGTKYDADGACCKPETFALIYPNGDVLPCNAIEYSHQPIVGNVLDHSLHEIWNGSEYEQFRRERTDFCLHCPVVRHTGVSISTTDNPPYAVPVVLNVPERLAPERPDVDPAMLTTREPKKQRFADTP